MLRRFAAALRPLAEEIVERSTSSLDWKAMSEERRDQSFNK